MGHCDDLWAKFQNHHAWSISPVLFEIGIPTLVCGYIFGVVECHILFLEHCDLDLWPQF